MHCPIVGVCLPIPVLRRLVEKTFRGSGKNVDNDYDLHAGSVGQCQSRTPLAEGLQRELERRYAASVRQAAQAKTTGALMAWWAEASKKELAGPLWATVTHPRCTPELERQVHGEVHMLQHQVGAAQRADLQRLDALLDENLVLARELARVQERSTQFARESSKRSERQQCLILRLRADIIARDTRVATLQEQINAMEKAVPALATRIKQAGEIVMQAERIHVLERALLLAQQENERRGRLIDAQAAEIARLASHVDTSVEETRSVTSRPVPLQDRAVLCVGGRTASVPLYRHIVERTGGRFIHHDGGEEESAAQLDATLAAADLVICQTGCISHNAYWRVKDYCKRTGKQCVFVENPGTASLKRALAELRQEVTSKALDALPSDLQATV
jgi:hypothetical protein